MKSHAKNVPSRPMVVKRMLDFKGSLGVILPREMTRALGLRVRSRVRVYFASPDKIVITNSKIKLKAGAVYGQN